MEEGNITNFISICQGTCLIINCVSNSLYASI